MKLDLGCGQNKKPDFTGVDKYEVPGVDQIVDLLQFPWPWADESIEEVWCSHFFEHVPGPMRGQWMDELYRVLKPNARATIIVPYANSTRATQDFTHAWPPVHEGSFQYFNRAWREVNALTHGPYDLKCDFEYSYGYDLFPYWQQRSQDAIQFALAHHLNAAADIQVFLTRR